MARAHAVLGCSPALHAPKRRGVDEKEHEEKSFDLLKFDTGVCNTVHAYTPHQSFLANQSLFRSVAAAVTDDAFPPWPIYNYIHLDGKQNGSLFPGLPSHLQRDFVLSPMRKTKGNSVENIQCDDSFVMLPLTIRTILYLIL